MIYIWIGILSVVVSCIILTIITQKDIFGQVGVVTAVIWSIVTLRTFLGFSDIYKPVDEYKIVNELNNAPLPEGKFAKVQKYESVKDFWYFVSNTQWRFVCFVDVKDVK